ncbi:TIGR03087 family PEP-CTERM/XrtA system glycosyltransferase [Rhodopila sp.]|uniref:TIGR03087 family PEP-CTERM/XrtA system glycosyltransferase n=1 Tax=Rhodopila sp. TaxID=2480087 RepID=UPI003D13C2F1
MPDLLFLAQRLPYPPTKGEKIRAFHELKYLAQWYDIHLGCLIDDPDDRQYIDALRPLCRDIYVGQINRRTARLVCLGGLLTADALSVTYFRHRGLIDWVNTVADTIHPAITFVYSSNMAPYVLDLPNTGTTVVDLVDVDSEKWRAFADATKGPMRLVYRREWRKIAELERRIARHSALSVLVSDAEAALFARHNPDCANTIRGVSNGVDHRYFDPGPQYPPPYDTTRPNFVFTGTMDYPPNVDAAVWFAGEILPLIQASLPAAQFHVVGSNPSPEVRKLQQRDGVFVTGRVPDVRPYIAHATAGVAPMRIARGIQNKVLEAMAMARPVVLTADALEGIAAVPMLEAILADSAADFAAACTRLATTKEGVAIGTAARRRIISNYDWQVTLRGFDDILCPLVPQAAVQAEHRSPRLQRAESRH